MGIYVPFTEEEKERAASADLEEFLRRRGEQLLPSGREKRLASDHSVTIRGCEWYDHEAQRGGGPVAFLQHFRHLSYPEAVQCLLSGDYGSAGRESAKTKKSESAGFALPPAAEHMRRLFAYLIQTRKISREVLGGLGEYELAAVQAAYARGRVTSRELSSLINRSQRSATRMLKGLSNRGVLEWHGISANDPMRYYTVA